MEKDILNVQIIKRPVGYNNIIPSVIPQAKFGEGGVYANLTPTL